MILPSHSGKRFALMTLRRNLSEAIHHAKGAVGAFGTFRERLLVRLRFSLQSCGPDCILLSFSVKSLKEFRTTRSRFRIS
jgi:hypothetical protein